MQPNDGETVMNRSHLVGVKCAVILPALVCLCSGCPLPEPSLGVSEVVHDFGDSECAWTFYVYNAGDGIGTFRVRSDVAWARALVPAGIVGPRSHTPVVVVLERSKLGKSDDVGSMTVTLGVNGIDERIEIIATNGSPEYIRVRDYWPFEVGAEWVFASHAEDVGGALGDTTRVETSTLAVTGYSRRFGFDVWEVQYTSHFPKSTKVLYCVFMDEFPVFVEDPSILDLLPDRGAFYDAAYSDGIVEYWLKGIFEPADLGVYTNTTRYSTLTLGEITPMSYFRAMSRVRTKEFPVPPSTPCLGLLDDPYNNPHQRRVYFALLGRGVGPLMDPFGDSGILYTYSFP